MEYLLDEPGRQKFLQLLANRPALELVEASQPRLHRLGVGSDIKGVLGDLPQYARHARGAPRKDVCVGAEKVDEHHFLFAVEGGADLQRLVVGTIRIEGHLLDTSAGSKLPACRCLESKASLAILSRVAARALSTA